MTAASALARLVVGLRWSALPLPVREKVKLHVLDTLGVMCAGHRAAYSASVLRVFEDSATEAAAPGAACVVGLAQPVPAADAAFCNAFLGRAHTFDDTFENGPVHPGSAVVAAALAAAEDAGASGLTTLEAIVAGYEVAVWVSRAAGSQHYAHGFHSTGTINAFAAAAAAAKAMGLEEEGIAGALGHAGGGASGLRQYQEDGGLADSAVNGARAAAWGVRSAQLARAGLAGPAGILDGLWGFLRVMSPQRDAGTLAVPAVAGNGVLSVSLKPYPSCRFTHGPVEVLRHLRVEEKISPGDVERVFIDAFKQSVEVSDKPAIETRSDAILAHQFAAACILLTGELTLDAFEEPMLHDAQLRALCQRVQVRHDAGLDAYYPTAWPHRITVRLHSGGELYANSEHPPGSPQLPMHDDEVKGKFLALCAARLGSARAPIIRDAVAQLEHTPNIRTFSALLQSA